MTLRILFNWQHGYELKKALQESKELKQQLTQKLEVIQEERALMQQCSIGHDSRARFYFALKKAEERYIDLAEEE